MKLPNLDRAIVRTEKISDYLLSTVHPAGRHKARFFGLFGFSRSSPESLTRSLIEHARSNEVSAVDRTVFGTRYTIDGTVVSPDGRNPRLRVIWFIESGSETPNFVTAYPLPELKT
jgi:hypothetical protein